MKRRQHTLFFLFTFLILFIICLVSLSVGRYSISIDRVVLSLLGQNVTASENMVVINLRLPRMIASVLIGAALSCSGMAYQGAFQNPLVSPDLLGVSSGACVGAVFGIMMHFNHWGIVVLAFLFGIVAVLMAVGISMIARKKTNLILLLSGIAVSEFMAAISGAFTYFADDSSELGEIVDWRLGSIKAVSISDLYYVTPIIIIGLSVMYLLRWRINLLSIGTREAKSLGVNVVWERYGIILFSTMITAASVSISGTIGWIGLIVPHISRWMIGNDNRYALPLSMLLGSCFMVVIDTLARSLTIFELPLSIITGFIGTPIFVLILAKRGAIHE